MKAFIEKFKNHYGVVPAACAQAPGRLEILGNHTDYNEGVVLSCAVEQTTKFALVPVPGTVCRLVDFRSGSPMEFDLEDMDAPPAKDGGKYVKGMIKQLMARGMKPTAFNGAIESSVPLSAGMSSSAALEVSAGLALMKAFDFTLSPADIPRFTMQRSTRRSCMPTLSMP